MRIACRLVVYNPDHGADLDLCAATTLGIGRPVFFFFFFFFRRHGEFDLDQLRAVVVECSRRMDKALVFSYDRQGVGQSGSGHFSPLGGYNEAEDLVLVLDTARFKYPPHWVKLDREAGFRPAPSLLSLGSHPPTPLPACRSI